ncbi:MAG: hypothetical protein IIA61_03840 [Candidatus Marinimicrobia bacterium]|nr:hypothetical protein [Candidatus Neomarinimicrobiota bacterium]
MKISDTGKIFSIIFFSIILLHSQTNKLFWDGEDWLRLTKESQGYPEFEYLMKASYVNGILDGRLYDYFTTWAINSGLADSLFAETVDYLRTSEIIRGLDHFYEDPLNDYIPVISAIVIVNMYGERQPIEMIEAFKEKSKEWINHLTIQLQQEDMFRLMEEKRKKHREKIKD